MKETGQVDTIIDGFNKLDAELVRLNATLQEMTRKMNESNKRWQDAEKK